MSSSAQEAEVRPYTRESTRHHHHKFCFQSIYSKAAKAELSKEWDQAFQLYIKSAEGYLHLNRTTSNERLRALCKSGAGKALERAEKIKTIKRNLMPISVNHFSERMLIYLYIIQRNEPTFCALSEEQFYILKKSSFINGLQFPLWDDCSTSRLSYV
jgi:calpain-7